MAIITDEIIYLCRIASSIAADKYILLRNTIKNSKKLKLDPLKIQETILQSYLFCGFPSTIEAMKIFKGIFPEFNLKKSGFDYQRFKVSGNKNCKLIYKNNFKKLIGNMNLLSADLKEWMIVEGYGKVLGRKGLSLLEREFINYSILSTRFYKNQLHSHAKGCLNLGASIIDLKILLKMNRRTISPLIIRKVSKLINNL